MYKKINQYLKFIKEINRMEKNKGIQARINTKAYKAKMAKNK